MNISKKLLLLGILILIVPIPFSMAWKNGSYAYTQDDYDPDTDFGTHDWIAKACLDYLIENHASSWTWLNERLYIFLLGTEAPDNSGISITLDGETIEGFGDTTWHHIYYNEDGSIKNNEDDAGLRAKACGDLADATKVEGKLDQASFYLGAMTHYIADLSMFSHTAENNVDPHFTDFDAYHSTIEGYVLTRTNDYNNLEEFFKNTLSSSISAETPYNVAVALGWNTYKDPEPSEATTRDAKWLHDNHFTDWKTTYDDRSTDTATHQSYYNRIEESLNLAIEGCISAMLSIGGQEDSLPAYPTLFLMGISAIAVVIVVKKTKRNL